MRDWRNNSYPACWGVYPGEGYKEPYVPHINTSESTSRMSSRPQASGLELQASSLGPQISEMARSGRSWESGSGRDDVSDALASVSLSVELFECEMMHLSSFYSGVTSRHIQISGYGSTDRVPLPTTTRRVCPPPSYRAPWPCQLENSQRYAGHALQSLRRQWRAPKT